MPEIFFYDSNDVKVIYNGKNNTGVCNTYGLTCNWSCEVGRLVFGRSYLDFSFKFNWEEMRKRGTDRLSGYIIVKPAPYEPYNKNFGEEIINVDLKEPNQITKIGILTQTYVFDHYRVLFEYYLTSHYAQIKQIAKPIIPIIEEKKNNFENSLIPHYTKIEKDSSSVQNETVPVIKEKKNSDANEKVISEKIVSTTEQNDAIPTKEEQNIDHINKEIHSDKLVSSSEQNDVILVNEKAKVQDKEVNSDEMVSTTKQKGGMPEKVVEKKTHVNEEIHTEKLLPSSEQNDNVPVKKEEEKIQDNEENLLSRLDKMFLSSEQNDAILVIDGKKIHVNKWFLSYHSEYFKNLFNDKDGQVNEIPIEGISFDDFKLLFGPIFLKPVFPTDETVEKLLELADRFKLPTVIHHCEHHLLHHSKIENEKMMWIGEQYGMKKVLAKAILEMDTIEKAKKWKQSPEYKNISNDTKGRVFDRII